MVFYCTFFTVSNCKITAKSNSAINYWLDDSKKAEGEPAPLTDEEEVVKYWKNSQIQK